MITEFEQGAKRRAQILARLKDLADESDAEKAHIEADALLCEYLTIINAKDIVEAFQAITKYYARPIMKKLFFILALVCGLAPFALAEEPSRQLLRKVTV